MPFDLGDVFSFFSDFLTGVVFIFISGSSSEESSEAKTAGEDIRMQNLVLYAFQKLQLKIFYLNWLGKACHTYSIVDSVFLYAVLTTFVLFWN